MLLPETQVTWDLVALETRSPPYRLYLVQLTDLINLDSSTPFSGLSALFNIGSYHLAHELWQATFYYIIKN